MRAQLRQRRQQRTLLLDEPAMVADDPLMLVEPKRRLRRDLPILGLDERGDLLEQCDQRRLELFERGGSLAIAAISVSIGVGGPGVERVLALHPRRQPRAHDAKTPPAPPLGYRRQRRIGDEAGRLLRRRADQRGVERGQRVVVLLVGVAALPLELIEFLEAHVRIPVSTMSKRAIITGITGQDGSYLAELLLSKGYEVVGTVRRSSAPNFWRIQHLLDRITLKPADLLDQLSIIRLVDEVRPHELYNLAAMSFVPASWDQPMLTGEFNAQGVTRVLEAIRQVDPSIPILPGLVERDVRQGARDAADRADAVLPAQPVRRVEGLRALHHGELPRELRPVRRLGHPLQPRVAAPRPRVRHAQGHRRRGADQARAVATRCRSATSTPSATGASPATTSRRCG